MQTNVFVVSLCKSLFCYGTTIKLVEVVVAMCNLLLDCCLLDCLARLLQQSFRESTTRNICNLIDYVISRKKLNKMYHHSYHSSS